MNLRAWNSDGCLSFYAREEEEKREFEVGVMGYVGVFHEVRAGQAHHGAQQHAENGSRHEWR